MVKSLILALVLVSSCSSADKKKVSEAPKPMTEEQKKEVMQKMMEAGKPSEAHKKLAQMAGKWTYTSRWWESAEATPQLSKGTADMKMIYGGRFLKQEIKGTATGAPYEGMSLFGYDNIKKKYESVWIDNMGTSMAKGTGEFHEATNTLMDYGQFSCPMTESKTAEYRGEWKIMDTKNIIYSMYGKGLTGDKEFKMMEMVFKRKK